MLRLSLQSSSNEHRHALDRSLPVGESRLEDGARHAVDDARLFGFREDHATGFADGARADEPVTAHSRQDDAENPGTDGARRRLKEDIDGGAVGHAQGIDGELRVELRAGTSDQNQVQPGACDDDPPVANSGPRSSTVTSVYPRAVSSSATDVPTMPAPMTTTLGIGRRSYIVASNATLSE